MGWLISHLLCGNNKMEIFKRKRYIIICPNTVILHEQRSGMITKSRTLI